MATKRAPRQPDGSRKPPRPTPRRKPGGRAEVPSGRQPHSPGGTGTRGKPKPDPDGIYRPPKQDPANPDAVGDWWEKVTGGKLPPAVPKPPKEPLDWPTPKDLPRPKPSPKGPAIPTPKPNPRDGGANRPPKKSPDSSWTLDNIRPKPPRPGDLNQVQLTAARKSVASGTTAKKVASATTKKSPAKKSSSRRRAV